MSLTVAQSPVTARAGATHPKGQKGLSFAYWLSSTLTQTNCPSFQVPPGQKGVANASDATSIATANAIQARSAFISGFLHLAEMISLDSAAAL